MVIKSKFGQNFLPKPIACNVVSLLNFLGSQELRYFNDIFDYEDNSSIPLSLSFERISSLLTLWQNDGDWKLLNRPRQLKAMRSCGFCGYFFKSNCSAKQLL